MKKSRQASIVLQITPVGESDLLVDLLSKDSGRLTASAKGARRSKKRFLGGIDIFDCGSFELLESRKQENIFTLTAIHDRKVWPHLRDHLSRFSLASFCIEVSRTFTVEGDPEGANLFKPLFLSLKSLNESAGEDQRYAVTAYFTLLVLRTSGFSILDSDFKLEQETRIWFEQMQLGNSPIVPFDRDILLQGLSSLISYSEQILGRQLKTAQQMINKLVLDKK